MCKLYLRNNSAHLYISMNRLRRRHFHHHCHRQSPKVAWCQLKTIVSVSAHGAGCLRSEDQKTLEASEGDPCLLLHDNIFANEPF